MDKLTKEQRHRCMSAIKGKNTKPELLVRKFLFGRGFRYRLNHPRLPGHPDLVLRKYRTVIFVNGCFWHGHEGCKYYVLPKTNVEFWKNKIERNRSRDIEERLQLTSMGWHCLTICMWFPPVERIWRHNCRWLMARHWYWLWLSCWWICWLMPWESILRKE